MRPNLSLSRLRESVQPSADQHDRIWSRIRARTSAAASMQSVVQEVMPTTDSAARIKQSMLARISPPIGRALEKLGSSLEVPSRSFQFLKALQPATPQPSYHAWLRWSAAFVLVVLAFRIAPLAFLPSTQADTGVQLVSIGDGVQVYVGGVWRSAKGAELLKSAVMIRTDADSEATVILNDDGVIRLAADTTLKLHDLSDHPDQDTAGVTATLVRGTVWALGLLPPFVDGLTLQTTHGTLALNAGSASVSDTDSKTTVSVFDRGVTFLSANEPTFLVAGEELVADTTVRVRKLSDRELVASWALENLSHDAVHRTEIAKLLEERNKKAAGILPGSALYPVKRVAEKVDSFFAFTSDARTEKQVTQANTRLSEALALYQDGQSQEAAAQLDEYSSSLVALANTGDDSLVRHLLVQTIANQTTTLASDTATTDEPDSVSLLRQAVDSVAEAVPDADLALRDLEGYLLVDKLAEIKTALESGKSPEDIARLYAEVRPYLPSILSEESTTNPLLKREAESLLLGASSAAQSAPGRATDPLLIALDTDIDTFLPAQSDALKVTTEELDARVATMVERILLFRSPGQRYNQLLVEMSNIVADPNRGTLLRRLKAALPDALGEYVNTELKKLTDELSA